MFTITIALAIGVGGLFIVLGAAKLAAVSAMNDARAHLDVPSPLWQLVGGLEILGGAGVLLGLTERLPPIGVLSAAGLVALTIGATYTHQRVGDPFLRWLPAVIAGSLAIFYGIMRVATA